VGGDVGWWRDLATRVVAGRKFIIVGHPLAGSAARAAGLRSLGAERPFVLASGVGTGDLPSPDDCAWHVLDAEGPNAIDAIRAYDAQLPNLALAAQAALDRWDPDGSALVWGTAIVGQWTSVGGRRPYASRSPAWVALEDKVAIDSFWDAAGVARAPSVVVPAERAALEAAAARLNRGAGTVWAGDARQGINGGAVFVKWVRSGHDAAAAAEFLAARCDRARVMPFLEGVPCSIHGMVLPDRTITFRPCELVTLRQRDPSRFLYAGIATFWDPSDRDRDEMRAAVVRTGETLRRTVDYRGAFGIDGVLTEDGFRPTELNSRYAGHAVLAGSVEGLPLYVLHAAAVAGQPFDYRSADLEALVLDAADAHRRGSVHAVTPTRFAETTTRPTTYGELLAGPSTVGGFVRLSLDPERVPVGPSVAPLGVEAFALADAQLGTTFGPLAPARDVRPRPNPPD